MPEARIRKGEHELIQSHFERFPFWEYALDEEGDPDQDETTMRPLMDARTVDRENNYGLLAARFRIACGREFFGIITIGSGIDGPFGVDKMSPHFSLGPEEDVYLSLPYERVLSDQAARKQAAELYQKLGCAASDVFPITIRPALPIKGLDSELRVDGFMRPADGTQVEVIV